LTSAVWHFGWGAEDMKATYQKQLDMGTKFFNPLTDISDIGGNKGATGLFYYAYVEGPDHALIELNTAQHHHFGHLHLFSEDPVSAGEWYMKYFGAVRRGSGPPSRAPRIYRDVPIGPNTSLMMDNVNIIIFPIAYSRKAYPEHWKNQTEMSSTKGRVVDHVGFSVDNLAESLEKLRKDGVRVTDEIKSVAGGKIKEYQISGDGSSGEFKCAVTLACSVGKGGTVSAVGGTPTYVDEGYVDKGWQRYDGEYVLPDTGDVAYQSILGVQPSDDGFNFETLSPGDIVKKVVKTNLWPEQQAVFPPFGAETPEAVFNILNTKKCGFQIDLKLIDLER
jgi:hypothetical protein